MEGSTQKSSWAASPAFLPSTLTNGGGACATAASVMAASTACFLEVGTGVVE